MKFLRKIFANKKKRIIDLNQELLNKNGAEQFRKLRALGLAIPIAMF